MNYGNQGFEYLMIKILSFNECLYNKIILEYLMALIKI